MRPSMAAVMGISTEVFEAADLDGCNALQRLDVYKRQAHIYRKKGKGYELRLMAKVNEFLYILFTNYSRCV